MKISKVVCLLPVIMSFIVGISLYTGIGNSYTAMLLEKLNLSNITETEKEMDPFKYVDSFVVIKTENLQVLNFEEPILGAESFWEHSEGIFTGSWDGRLVMLGSENDYKEIIRLGQNNFDGCQHNSTRDSKQRCSRLLGIAERKRNVPEDVKISLYLADVWNGLYQLDIKKSFHLPLSAENKKKSLKLLLREVDGKPLHFINSLYVDENGFVYFTDSSQNVDIINLIPAIFEEPNGRLIRYDPMSGKPETLLDNLSFANGLEKSTKDSLLICETLGSRIIEYHLSGENKGKATLWTKNLPILPDNIKKIPDIDHFLVGGLMIRPLPQQLRAKSYSNDAAGESLQGLLAMLVEYFRDVSTYHGQFLKFLFFTLSYIPVFFSAAGKLLHRGQQRKGGKFMIMDSAGRIKKVVSLPKECSHTSEVVLTKSIGKESVYLVGSYARDQPLCKIPSSLLA